MKLLELLKQLFGQNYLNKIIGTRTNIAKPIKMDRNSPYKLYSDKAFMGLMFFQIKMHQK